MRDKSITLVVHCLLLVGAVFSFPQIDKDATLVVVTTENPKETNENEVKEEVAPVLPKIYQMNINTNVSNRFAKTVVSSRVKNLDKHAQEATFSVVLPETAYISGFIMEIDGKSYEAYIKEKEEAKQIYDQAVSSGTGAGHVAVSARDSNRFTVSINVEPQSKAVFHLKYEELLKRVNEQYDIVLNIHPGQPVADLNVEVHINESRPLKFVKVPSLRSGNEISKNEDNLDPKAQIEQVDPKTAVVKFNPDIDRQKEFAAGLGTKEDNGLAGQFIVEYDVERDPHGGEVLVQDGYFVHFFAPTDLPPLPKLVVFVLDTSGSMDGIRIKQLKEAMNSILPQLSENDAFHIVEFGSTVKVWNVANTEIQYEKGEDYYPYFGEPEVPKKNKSEQTLPSSFAANEDNKKNAKVVVDKLAAFGGTDIKSALEVGLELIGKHKKESDNKQQPIIVFLTDGEPTVGETSTEAITTSITKLNEEKTPIFSLSFGDGADREFLQKISLKNQGFARHIYEAADASLQLEQFYKQISSPLLKDVKFEYVNNTVGKLTRTVFPILFSGSELVVAGEAGEGFEPGQVFCGTIDREIILKPEKVERPVSGIERIWAYLNIKQILEQRDIADNKTEYTQKALDIALKYSFVTPVSSLVVVKPNDTKSDVDTEDASKVDRPYFVPHFGSFAGPPSFNGAQAASFSSGAQPLGLSYSSSHTVGFPPAPAPAFGQASAGGLIDRIELESDSDSHIIGGGYGGQQFYSSTPLYPTSASMAPPSLPPAQTTEKPVNATQESHPLDELKSALPWLVTSLGDNSTQLTLPSGVYDIGLDATIADHPECPKTPVNGTLGHCQLLKDCAQVHTLLTDFQVYSQYFCELSGYAGVCCPPNDANSTN